MSPCTRDGASPVHCADVLRGFGFPPKEVTILHCILPSNLDFAILHFFRRSTRSQLSSTVANCGHWVPVFVYASLLLSQTATTVKTTIHYFLSTVCKAGILSPVRVSVCLPDDDD